MSKRILAATAVGFLVGGIGGSAMFLAAKPSENTRSISAGGQPLWNESAWPFPTDEWGGGWSFQCKAADCGTDVNLYVRPKIGFCNCQTGVADDEELDRVSDLDLIGGDRKALAPGRPITVHWMKGRSRGYTVGASSNQSVLSLAFNSRCDVVVATVIAGDEPEIQEHTVLEFLNSDLVLSYVQAVGVTPPPSLATP